MAEVDSYPSAGRDTGDGDGVISDVEYEALVSTFYPTGIIGTPAADGYPVYTDGSGIRGVHFRANALGMVHGCRVIHPDTDVTLNAAANDGANTRYDLAVWRLDRAGDATTVRPDLITGGSSPAGPAPVQDPFSDASGKWDYPLLIVPVEPGQTSIPGSVNTLARKVGYWLAPPRYNTLKGAGTPPPNKSQEIFEWDTNTTKMGDGVKYLTIDARSGAPAAIVARSGWAVRSGTVEKVDGTIYVCGFRIDRIGGPLVAQVADQVIANVPANQGLEPAGGPKLIGIAAGGLAMVYFNPNGTFSLVYNQNALPTDTQMYFGDVACRAAVA